MFGAAAPAAKVLVGDVPPLWLAGFLYLGSGVGLALVVAVRKIALHHTIAPIPKSARLRFAGAIVAGGVMAPALLMMGLAKSSASTSSLLLNLEAPFTALVAWLVVREHTHARIVAGFVAIALGGVVLSVDWSALHVDVSTGALFVVAACACWAVDNNLTQTASSADPMLIACTKGVVAGTVSCALAFAFSSSPKLDASIGAALIVGFFGYGVSLVLFVVGLRHLGTARTGAYFSTAPFVGALLSFALLHEAPTIAFAVAATLMIVGVVLHLGEQHAHEHVHDALVHSHAHVHDEHHRHAHAPGVSLAEPHVHEHVHERLIHVHAHVPDIHHRHDHG